MEIPSPVDPIDIPATSPVMILPECNLLPHALLPLYIFEPRYREMLTDALAQDRLFCIGMQRAKAKDERDTEPTVSEHSTIGLIRASVSHEDGTSHLVLQGLQRVRFVDWIEGRPYSQARIKPVESIISNRLQAEALAARLLEIADKLVRNGMEISDQLRNYLSTVGDPDAIADIVAYNFIPDPSIRQKVLETPEVSTRLELVMNQLA